jgi:NAD(P)H-dependent FMN reductase
MEKPLYIPMILGTVRRDRMSRHVARFVYEEFSKFKEIETEIVDVCDLNLPNDDAGEQIKHPEFSAKCERADGLLIVTPEYNHGYPGMLKHALDTNLKEYVHKAVGVCAVSAGGFGGTRVIENLLPVFRELGLVTIFWDGNFSSVGKLFDENGNITDPGFAKRMQKFFKELIWMSTTLRNGRENVKYLE